MLRKCQGRQEVVSGRRPMTAANRITSVSGMRQVEQGGKSGVASWVDIYKVTQTERVFRKPLWGSNRIAATPHKVN